MVTASASGSWPGPCSRISIGSSVTTLSGRLADGVAVDRAHAHRRDGAAGGSGAHRFTLILGARSRTVRRRPACRCRGTCRVRPPTPHSSASTTSCSTTSNSSWRARIPPAIEASGRERARRIRTGRTPVAAGHRRAARPSARPAGRATRTRSASSTSGQVDGEQERRHVVAALPQPRPRGGERRERSAAGRRFPDGREPADAVARPRPPVRTPNRAGGRPARRGSRRRARAWPCRPRAAGCARP